MDERRGSLDAALDQIERHFGRRHFGRSPEEQVVEAETRRVMAPVYEGDPAPPLQSEDVEPPTREELLAYKAAVEEDDPESVVDIDDPDEVAWIAASMPWIRWQKRMAEQRK